MLAQAARLHIATSTGIAHWALIVHASAGTIALITGFVALAAGKGSRLHRMSGLAFVYAMVTMALFATAIALYEQKTDVLGALFVAYLIVTATTAVRPANVERRFVTIAFALFALLFGIGSIRDGIEVMSTASQVREGVPFGMFFFLGAIALLAGVGDLRMVYAGALRGRKRIARHLWRMCFGLFVASGSFFLGQIRFFPKPLQNPALLMIPAVLPLAALLYWLWRVRVRQSLRGMPPTAYEASS